MDKFFNSALDNFEKSFVEPLQAAAEEIVDETVVPAPSSSEASETPFAAGRTPLSGIHAKAASDPEGEVDPAQFWTKFAFEERRAVWEKTRQRVQGLPKVEPGEPAALADRAVAAEDALLALCEELGRAPDPAVLATSAQQAVVKLQQSEQECRKLREELQGDHAELETMRDVQSRLQFLEVRNKELEVQQQQQQQSEASELSLREEYEALQQREHEASQELTRTQATLSRLKRAHEASEMALFGLEARAEEERAAHSRQLDTLSDDLDRATEESRSLRQEKKKAIDELTMLKASKKPHGMPPSPPPVFAPVFGPCSRSK
ncbi:hypothetical protein CYMTET_11270, partial [Cymbomonas tetramitiformis]